MRERILRSNQNTQNWSYKTAATLTVVAVIFSVLAVDVNFGRAMLVASMLFTLAGVTLITQNWFISILSVALVFLPFNVTAKIGTTAYLTGVPSNFLTTYISLVDLILVCAVVPAIFSISISRDFRVLLLIALLILSATVSPSLRSLVFLLRYTSVVLVLNYVYINRSSLALHAAHYRDQLLKVGIISLTVQLLFSLYQVALGTSLGISALGESVIASSNPSMAVVSLNGELLLRAYGTFPHPNVLAIFAIFMIVFALLINGKTLLRYTIYVLSLVLIALSFSKAALAIVACFALYEVFTRRSLLPVFYTSIGLERAWIERTRLLDASTSYFREQWFTGVGIGNFLERFYTHAPFGVNGHTLLQPVHNIFALLMVEGGVFVGSVIIASLAYVLYQSYSLSQDKRIPVYVALVILISGNLDHLLVTLPQGIAIFLGLIILSILVMNTKTEKQEA